MALLFALHSIAGRRHWKIVVAHFNHQLRGRSSDADEKLVRKTAVALGLPFVVGRAEVAGFAKRSKLSVEMAARKLRHEFFARIAGERKIFSIVLAHHADDQIELFFLRMLRGAGGEGMAGMKWSSPSSVDPKIKLVRPLLDFSKGEILAYAKANKIPFREDATNRSNDFLRNRVRNELLPLLRGHYQPGLTKTVLRLMEIIGAEAEVIGRLAGNWVKHRRSGFGKLPVAVQRRVLQMQLGRLNVVVDFDLVEQLRESAEKCVSIGSGLSVSRDPDGRLKLREQPPMDFNPNELQVNLRGRAGETEFDGAILRWYFEPHKKHLTPHEFACEFYDADKIGKKIILRHWRAGDRFQPIGLKTAVKLQDLFTNEKIPRDRRRDLLVATVAGGEIFWVESLRISENFKLTQATRRRFIWQWRRSR